MVYWPTGLFVGENERDSDPYELLHQKVPLLAGLTKESFPSFLSLGAAAARGLETNKEDGYIKDIYAEALAGEPAQAFKETFNMHNDQESMGYVVLRHRLVNEEIEENLNPEIQQVVFVGAGMDTRSYRMPRFANCHVFELDSCKELAERKARILKEMDAKLIAKEHDVIITDLSKNTWPDDLVARGFDVTKPTMWIAEALLQFLDEDSIDRLFTTIDSLSAPKSHVFADMLGTGYMPSEIVVVNGELNWYAGTVVNKQEGGVLRALPWKKEYLLHRTADGVYSGKRWDPSKFPRYHVPKDKAKYTWFVASCIKPEKDE